MYDKRLFQKINDKKILHKIGKRWAVLSVSLLGAFGLTGMVTSHAHADNTSNSAPDSSSTNHQSQSKQANLIPLTQSNQAESSNNNEVNEVNTIQSQASLLHQRILTNGIKTINHHDLINTDTYQNSGSKNNDISYSQHHLYQTVTGQWGTAPFQFDQKTGTLKTTGHGQIIPITKLNNPRVNLNQIRSIQFAPGTTAPRNSSDLFAAGYDTINTSDGTAGSDSIAYVSQLRNLKYLDLSNLDTSNVVNMTRMFLNDSGLQNINFGKHFNTNNVQSMASMFESDSKLKSLDLDQFNTANILDMNSMFQSDYALSDLNLGSNFNTRYTVYMYNMFRSDNSLKHLDLGNKFNTSYVIDSSDLNNYGFSHMFTNDYNLLSLDLGPNFNTERATNFSDMFANDSDLSSLNLGQQFVTSQAKNMHNMFKGDSSLKYLNLGPDFDTILASTQNYKSKSSDKNPYGIPNVLVQYHGADGIFASDDELNTLVMDNTRLIPSVNLSVPSKMHWYLTINNIAQERPFNLTNGQRYSGTYSLCTDVPIVTTTLNFVDDTNHNMIVNQAPIYGLNGAPITYGAIVNNIKNGYQLDIPAKDYVVTFPNMPFKYQSGNVMINVKPILSRVKQDHANESAASYATKGANEADQKITSYYQNSVLNSVSNVNQQKARLAAQSADQNIDNSIAQSAAHSADLQLESSIANSYATSADHQIESSEKASVIDSVSVANQQRAKSAAESTNQSIKSSIASSAAASADQGIDSSIAQSAARSADLQLESSIANSYATSADQRIRALKSSSVNDVASIANQQSNNTTRVTTSGSKQPSQNSVSALTSVKRQSLTDGIVDSTDPKLESSTAQPSASYSNSSDINLEQESADKSLSAANQANIIKILKRTMVSTENSFQDTHTDSKAKDADSYQAQSDFLGALTQSQSSLSTAINDQKGTAPQTEVLNSQSNYFTNKAVNSLTVGQHLRVNNSIITRMPMKLKWLKIKQACLAHNHIDSIGQLKDYSKVLHRGMLIQAVKMFYLQSGLRKLTRYEILLNHHYCFVTGNTLYMSNAYWQPHDLRRSKVNRWGVIIKPCFAYINNSQVQRLHRNEIVHIKRILRVGNRRDGMTKIMLTNGQLITSNKKYVKII